MIEVVGTGPKLVKLTVRPARYEMRLDFERDNYVTHSGKFSIGKRFQKTPLNVSLAFEKPV